MAAAAEQRVHLFFYEGILPRHTTSENGEGGLTVQGEVYFLNSPPTGNGPAATCPANDGKDKISFSNAAENKTEENNIKQGTKETITPLMSGFSKTISCRRGLYDKRLPLILPCSTVFQLAVVKLIPLTPKRGLPATSQANRRLHERSLMITFPKANPLSSVDSFVITNRSVGD